MLDLTGILFSSIMMLIVMLRAVQWDSREPWFDALSDGDKPLTGLQKARENAVSHIPPWRRKKPGKGPVTDRLAR